MKNLIVFSVLIAAVLAATSAHAWPIYHKPEFRGRIIGAETKEPIEGAVVVVFYYKCHLVGNPGGANDVVMKAKETLTDKKGEFYFSSYSSFIPLSYDAGVDFIIFKPGYKSAGNGDIIVKLLQDGRVCAVADDNFFVTDVIGKEGELKYMWGLGDGEQKMWKGPLGVLELKKVRDGMPPGGIPADFGAKELPLLYKAINEDRKERGLEGEVK